MRILTDIPPTVPECPDPTLSWRRLSGTEAIADPLASLVFHDEPVLFESDAGGPKSSGAFPVVYWRGVAERSHLDVAFEALARKLPVPDGAVFVARAGHGFRGHFDREWLAGQRSLQLTVVGTDLRWPIDFAGQGLPALPILALYDFATGIAGKSQVVAVKWINDILLNGAKVGGALSRARSSAGMFEAAAFGMGVNIGPPPGELSANVFVPRAAGLDPGSLSDVGALLRLLSAFASNRALLERAGGQALAERYAKACAPLLGREVRLFEDGPALDDSRPDVRPVLVRGRWEGISPDLGIVINGRAWHRGRLAFESDLRPTGY